VGDMLVFDLEADVCDIDVAGAENLWFLGLIIDYWPNFMRD